MHKGIVTLHPHSRIEQFAAGTEVIVKRVSVMNILAIAAFTIGQDQFIGLVNALNSPHAFSNEKLGFGCNCR